MKTLLPYLFCTLACAPLFATSIIVLRSNSQAVVAADSKRTYSKDGRATKTMLACKIHVKDGVIFAAAGHSKDGDEGGYDYVPIATDAIRPTRSIGEIADSFAEEMITPLHRYSKHLIWEPDSPQTDRFLTVVFVGFRNGVPVTAVREWNAVKKAKSYDIELLRGGGSCPPNCSGRAIDVIRAGDTQGVVPRINSLADLLPAAIQTIHGDIDAFPDTVGPPVNAVVIDAAGVRWVTPANSVCNQR